jgi:hypothetical protein
MRPEPLRVVGYCRVSTDEQASSDLGLAAQRAAIERTAAAKGWELVDVVVDAGASGKDLERPGIRQVLDAVAAGEVDGLVVARLSRSLSDPLALVDWLNDAGASWSPSTSGSTPPPPAGAWCCRCWGRSPPGNAAPAGSAPVTPWRPSEPVGSASPGPR